MDPAAAKMISGIKKSMIAAQENGDYSGGGEVNEDKIIKESIQNYLSKADQFATRVSMIYKSRADVQEDEDQNALFVDSGNVNLKDKLVKGSMAAGGAKKSQGSKK
jgi:hypothetical protein